MAEMILFDFVEGRVYIQDTNGERHEPPRIFELVTTSAVPDSE